MLLEAVKTFGLYLNIIYFLIIFEDLRCFWFQGRREIKVFHNLDKIIQWLQSNGKWFVGFHKFIRFNERIVC